MGNHAALGSYAPLQCAEPDLRIPMDVYVPPAPRRADALPAIATAPTWDAKARSFPEGADWRVNSDNAAIWARHRFEGHFSERVLRLIGDPEGHPLFELRLDILEFEVLFCRYIGIPHNPQLLTQELGAIVGDKWQVRATATVRPSNPPIWKPPTPHLESYLRASCRCYADGLADFLRPGREHWGRG